MMLFLAGLVCGAGLMLAVLYVMATVPTQERA